MENAERQDLNVKISDLRICMPPKRENTTTELLATFTLVAFPVVVQDVRLVRREGNIEARSPALELRFMAAAREVITDAAKSAVRNALTEMQALD